MHACLQRRDFLKGSVSIQLGKDLTEAKGVVLIRDEAGNEKIYTKYIYLRMKNAGRKIELLEEAFTVEELNRKSRRF